MKLPKTGHNIQISHMVNDIHDGELFGKMSAELDYIFPILDGKIQEYQGENMGIFTINVDDAHLQAVTDYLNAHELRWSELKQSGDSTEGGGESCH
jgi:D-methionine transport system ATP-binding protein